MGKYVLLYINISVYVFASNFVRIYNLLINRHRDARNGFYLLILVFCILFLIINIAFLYQNNYLKRKTFVE